MSDAALPIKIQTGFNESTFYRKIFTPTLFLDCVFAPRLTQLNHFVNSDERKWLARSANFYLALTQHDWVHTYQKEHPGVTVTWAGAAGFLWRYPAYVRETPGAFLGEKLDLEHFLAPTVSVNLICWWLGA